MIKNVDALSKIKFSFSSSFLLLSLEKQVVDIFEIVLAPLNACRPNPCGMHALCELDNNNPVCYCPKGMTGNPFKQCSKYICSPRYSIQFEIAKKGRQYAKL